MAKSLAGRLSSCQQIRKLRRALAEAGVGRAHLVGGAVRDAAMGLELCAGLDLDVALPEVPEELVRDLADRLDYSFFQLDEDTEAWRLVAGDETVDLVAYRADDLPGDLAGRDFTVNAVALDLISGRDVYDPTDGLRAIREGILRPCGPTSLADDPLRVLRAYRLAATHGFAFDPDLPAGLKRHSSRLGQVSPERVRDEILRTFGGPRGSMAVRRMVRHGVMGILHPFTELWKGFDQGSYHSHDLLTHSLLCMDFIEGVAADKRLAPVAGEIESHLDQRLEAGITRRALLKWTAFFHDVAKPDTVTVEESGRRRFIGHDLKGGEQVATMLEKMKVGKKCGAASSRVVAAHMRMFGLAHQERPTVRSRLRYLRDLGDETPEAVLLSLADEEATGPRDPAERAALWKTGLELLDLYFNLEAPVEPLVRGRDLVETFGLDEGPRVGELLSEVALAETRGEVSDHSEAMELVKRLLEV